MKIIVVGTNNCWGRADTITQALKNAENPKHYAAFLCSDQTKVSDIDGGLEFPLSGGEPILLDRKLPKTAKPRKVEVSEAPAVKHDDSIVITMVERIETAIDKWQKASSEDTDHALIKIVGEALGNARLELSRLQRQEEFVTTQRKAAQ